MNQETEKINVKTPWGVVMLEGNSKGISKLRFSGSKRAKSAAKNPVVRKSASLLKQYFEGRKVSLSSLKIDQESWTPFEKKVYQALRKVKPGKVVTYQELAKAAGSPRAYRAVGSAMRKNRVPVVIPCHRVLGSNGRLCGFSGGLHWKRRLLELEGVEPPAK